MKGEKAIIFGAYVKGSYCQVKAYKKMLWLNFNCQIVRLH
jgi:hypothetical protein